MPGGLQPGEEVLVICNPVTEELGALLRINAQGEGGEATLAVISERESHAAEPPEAVAAAMLPPTSSSPRRSSRSPTPKPAKWPARPGCAVASMPGVTEEMLARVMGADMEALRKRGALLGRLLGGGAEARITCPHGSDLRLGLRADGDRRRRGAEQKGAFGNIPCGEAFIAPVEGPRRERSSSTAR